MKKTVLLTGATDGIGLELAKQIVSAGHQLLIHGRSSAKLDTVSADLAALSSTANIEIYLADLSHMDKVVAMGDAILGKHDKLDVLINNAGIFKTDAAITKDGLDIRFMVNTFAPYQLTQRLLPIMDTSGRVINLSSAAQATVDLDAMAGRKKLDAMEAYSQSKLAITMWSQELAKQSNAPISVAVNPGSLLASKMVKEGFGVEGSDLSIGSNILYKAAFDEEFQSATGKYFDNDSGGFALPHPDAQNAEITSRVVNEVKELSARLAQ